MSDEKDRPTSHIEFAPVLRTKSGLLVLKTPEDWRVAEETIKESPPLSCSIFGVHLLIS